jgi:hypothetical protein
MEDESEIVIDDLTFQVNESQTWELHLRSGAKSILQCSPIMSFTQEPGLFRFKSSYKGKAFTIEIVQKNTLFLIKTFSQRGELDLIPNLETNIIVYIPDYLIARITSLGIEFTNSLPKPQSLVQTLQKFDEDLLQYARAADTRVRPVARYLSTKLSDANQYVSTKLSRGAQLVGNVAQNLSNAYHYQMDQVEELAREEGLGVLGFTVYGLGSAAGGRLKSYEDFDDEDESFARPVTVVVPEETGEVRRSARQRAGSRSR